MFGWKIFSLKVLTCLNRAVMVLTNIRIWRDFIISRDSDVINVKGLNKSIQPRQRRINTSVRMKDKKGQHFKKVRDKKVRSGI